MWNKILEFLHIRKKTQATKDNGLLTAEPEVRPDYDEGYSSEENTIIRLISPKKKNASVYQVTGIDDVASKNNWKAWLYLAPVIVLISVFLLYPLVNTIFIKRSSKNYGQIFQACRFLSYLFQCRFCRFFKIGIFQNVTAGVSGKYKFRKHHQITSPATDFLHKLRYPVSVVFAISQMYLRRNCCYLHGLLRSEAFYLFQLIIA